MNLDLKVLSELCFNNLFVAPAAELAVHARNILNEYYLRLQATRNCQHMPEQMMPRISSFAKSGDRVRLTRWTSTYRRHVGPRRTANLGRRQLPNIGFNHRNSRVIETVCLSGVAIHLDSEADSKTSLAKAAPKTAGTSKKINDNREFARTNSLLAKATKRNERTLCTARLSAADAPAVEKESSKIRRCKVPRRYSEPLKHLTQISCAR